MMNILRNVVAALESFRMETWSGVPVELVFRTDKLARQCRVVYSPSPSLRTKIKMGLYANDFDGSVFPEDLDYWDKQGGVSKSIETALWSIPFTDDPKRSFWACPMAEGRRLVSHLCDDLFPRCRGAVPLELFRSDGVLHDHSLDLEKFYVSWPRKSPLTVLYGSSEDMLEPNTWISNSGRVFSVGVSVKATHDLLARRLSCDLPEESLKELDRIYNR